MAACSKRCSTPTGVASAGRRRSASRARVRTGGLLVRMRVPGRGFADYRIEAEVDEPRAPSRRRSRAPATRRLRARRGPDRDRRRRGARVAVGSRGRSSSARRPAPQPALGRARRDLLRRLRARGTTSTRRTCSPATEVARTRGRALGRGRRGAGGGLTRDFPARPRHPLASAGLLLRRGRPLAPPRLRRRGRRRLGAGRAHVRRARRGRWAGVPDQALGATDAGLAIGCWRARPWSRSGLSSSKSDERAGALAHTRLALQREGALGARPQGRRARTARA